MQDISTLFGLNNAYVYSEYMHAAAQVIYSTPNNEIQLPIEINKNFVNVELEREVNELCTGDITTLSTLIVLDVKEQKVKTKYSSPYFSALEQEVLILPRSKTLIFGARAIMESMAFLVERNVEPHCNSADEYPYHAARIVAYTIYSEFAQDDMRLIALCDMSLNSSNPGKTFVQMLKTYKEKKELPTPEKIYDDLYSAPCFFMGKLSNFIDSFLPMAMKIADRLNLYLNDNRFYPFHDTVRKMIGSGINYRINHRTFMLDIARGGDVNHNEALRKVMARFGSPVINDNQGNYSQVPSRFFDNSLLYIFVAVEQLYKTLSDCQDGCELCDWCDYEDDNGHKRVNVDERCFNAPWLRAHDERLCPYALLWRHWNFSKRKVINPNEGDIKVIY